MDDAYFPYHSEPVRGALILSLVLGIVSAFLLLVMPLLVLQLIVASFPVGSLVWTGLQLLRRRHGIRLEAEQIVIHRPVTGLRKCIQYAHIQGLDLLPDKLLIAYAKPVIADPTYQPLSLSEVRPATEQRKLVIVRGIDQLDQFAEALRNRVAAKDVTLKLTRNVMEVWANRIKVRMIIFVILGILASPLGCIIVFRIISSMIGR